MDERDASSTQEPESAATAQTVARLRLLHAVDRGILAGREPQSLITEALAALVALVGVDRASLTEIDRVHRQLHVFAQHGPGGFRSPFLPLDRMVTDAWLAAPGAEAFPDLSRAGAQIAAVDHLIDNGTRSLARFPVLDQGRLWVLAISARQTRDWTATEMEILQEVAAQLVIAIRHAATRAELAEQEARLRRVLRQAANAMLIVDGTMRIDEVNPAAIWLLELPPERLIGAPVDHLLALDAGPMLATRIREVLSELSERGPGRVFAGTIVVRDRRLRVTVHVSRLSSGISGTALLELVPDRAPGDTPTPGSDASERA